MTTPAAKPLKLLIFDLDGTLMDSAPDIINTVNGLMKARGRAALPDSQIIAAIGEGLKATVFKLFPECHGDAKEMETLEQDFIAHYEANLTRLTKPFPGLLRFLKSISSSAKIAIVTNKYAHLAKDLVAKTELNQIDWLVVFGVDSLPARKPDPLPLLEAMKLAGAKPEESVMIGDGTPDMNAARAAGVAAIACEFGYTSLEILREAGATTSIRSYDELPKRLRELGFQFSEPGAH